MGAVPVFGSVGVGSVASLAGTAGAALYGGGMDFEEPPPAPVVLCQEERATGGPCNNRVHAEDVCLGHLGQKRKAAKAAE
jgi:hypothetical protein